MWIVGTSRVVVSEEGDYLKVRDMKTHLCKSELLRYNVMSR